MPRENSKITITVCPDCGGKLVHESFMVDDGHGDVDWDEENYCKNPKCPSNNLKIKKEKNGN
jgi:Zn finger protein HypA/HybF involved in hydrogenase expression